VTKSSEEHDEEAGEANAPQEIDDPADRGDHARKFQNVTRAPPVSASQPRRSPAPTSGQTRSGADPLGEGLDPSKRAE
jgi:hypothetical protein